MASKSVGTIKSCGRLGHAADEDLMVDMVDHEGVTTVAIDASGREFQLYSGGIYHSNSCSSSRLNHAVTMTGYGGSGSNKYFEVKTLGEPAGVIMDTLNLREPVIICVVLLVKVSMLSF